MGYHPVFKLAFEEGCGIPYATVQASREYLEHLENEYRIYRRYSPKKLEGGLLRDGHFQACRTVNSAIRDLPLPAREYSFRYGREARRERALLRFLGQSLVQAGTACLPPATLPLAARWKEANLDDRYKLVAELYNCFQDARSGTANPVQESDNPYYWLTEVERRYPIQSVLPKQFGELGKGAFTPSCVGMATLLIAWARLAGAEVLLTNLLTYAPDLLWEVEGRLCSFLLDEFQLRQLTASEELVEGLRRNVAFAEANAHRLLDFHAAMTIKLDDGHWYYFDPYLNGFNPLPLGNWELYSAQMLLDRTKPVLPGLTITLDDQGFLSKWLSEQEASVRTAAAASIRLEQAVSRLTLDPAACQPFFEASKELRQLRRLCRAGRSRLSNLAGRLMFDWKKGVTQARQTKDWARFCRDEPYRTGCLSKLFLAFYISAKKRYHESLDRLNNGLTHLPTNLELAHPEFNLSLHTLNNLRCWDPGFNLPGYWFLRHSSSQIFWHQACVLHGDSQSPYQEESFLLEEAERVVRSQKPNLHRAVQFKLDWLEQIRETERG